MAFLYGANFSMGVLAYFKWLEMIGPSLSALDYDVSIREAHHRYKEDNPSGTALKMGDILVSQMKHKTKWVCNETRATENEIHISGLRCGDIFGEHTALLDSPWDTIEITHRLKNREALAKGAIDCALWLQGKRGFYSTDDYIKSIMERR